MCWILPKSDAHPAPTKAGDAVHAAERAITATFSQLAEGLGYIRSNPSIFWSLSYLAITASLVGVLGVLGPDFAVRVLGLAEADFVIVVLPLGMGLVLGILLLNVYGKYFSRQRIIEGGLVALGISLVVLGLAQRVGGPFLAGEGISLLTVVVVVAFVAGVTYAFVAVPAQTQLQEELPADVRGRVFGVLNMLVSVASFLPIIVVGPVSDLVGPAVVLVGSAVVVGALGVVSAFKARPRVALAHHQGLREPVDPLTVTSTKALTQPVPLRYVDRGPHANPPIVLASPVVPGRSGPAEIDDVAGGPPPAERPEA
jgi:MFS-type transporter involved in bile tolerance (Atg22 family)